MPKAPPRPCTYPRCTKYAEKGGRCAEHEVRHRWNHKGNRHERGYGSKWDKLRKSVLLRDQHLCQHCLQLGIYTKATDVDHINPKSLGGTDDFDNLQSLCKKCHRAKSLEEAKNG